MNIVYVTLVYIYQLQYVLLQAIVYICSYNLQRFHYWVQFVLLQAVASSLPYQSTHIQLVALRITFKYGLNYTSYRLAWYWLWWSGLWTHSLVLDILLRPSSSIKHPQNVVRKGTLTQLNVNTSFVAFQCACQLGLILMKKFVMNPIYEIFI